MNESDWVQRLIAAALTGEVIDLAAGGLLGLKLFGWLQTGILLAGLTGLLKKT